MRSWRPFWCGDAGLDEIGQDAEADPPDGERREPAERLGGEGDAVIGVDPLGQAVRAEQALEDGTGLDQLGAGERLTAEQHAAVAVGDGEREAVRPSPSLNWPL